MLARRKTCSGSHFPPRFRRYSSTPGWVSDIYDPHTLPSSRETFISRKPPEPSLRAGVVPLSKVRSKEWKIHARFLQRNPLTYLNLDDKNALQPLTATDLKQFWKPLSARGWDLNPATVHSPTNLYRGPALWNQFYLARESLRRDFAHELLDLLWTKYPEYPFLYKLEIDSDGIVRLCLASQNVPHPDHGLVPSLARVSASLAIDAQRLYEEKYVPLQRGIHPWKTNCNIGGQRTIPSFIKRLESFLEPPHAKIQPTFSLSTPIVPSTFDPKLFHGRHLDQDHLLPLQLLYERGWRLFLSDGHHVTFTPQGQMFSLFTSILPLTLGFLHNDYQHPSLKSLAQDIIKFTCSRNLPHVRGSPSKWRVIIQPWYIKTLLWSEPLQDPDTQAPFQPLLPTASPSSIHTAFLIDQLATQHTQPNGIVRYRPDPVFQPATIPAIKNHILNSFAVVHHDPNNPEVAPILSAMEYIANLSTNSSSPISTASRRPPLSGPEVPTPAEVSLLQNSTLLVGLPRETRETSSTHE